METQTKDIMHQLLYKGNELGKLQMQERGAIGVQKALSLQTQIADTENDIAELKRELLALDS